MHLVIQYIIKTYSSLEFRARFQHQLVAKLVFAQY